MLAGDALAPAPWLALCWLMAPLAGWLALLLTRKRSQVRLTCPVTAEKGKPFSVTAEVRQGVPFGRGRLTVSVENTVTGETHREKLTLHQGRGAWQVQSACCGCLVMQAGGAGAVGSAGRAADEGPLHGAGTHLRHAGYLPH